MQEGRKRRKKKDARTVVTDFLSGVVDDENADMKDRLKASELLSKTIPPDTGEKTDAIEICIDYGGEK